MKWNEWGFRPPLCTYRLNWARRTSWGWWDEWDDTALKTQDSKFEPWRSEAEQATSRSRRLPTILILYEWAGKKHFVSLKRGARTRDLRLSKQAKQSAEINPFSAGTVIMSQNLTSVDVRFWRIKSIPALKELKDLYCSQTHNIGIQMNQSKVRHFKLKNPLGFRGLILTARGATLVVRIWRLLTSDSDD